MAGEENATDDFRNLLLNRAFSVTPTDLAIVSGAIGSGAVVATREDTALGNLIDNWNSGADYKGFEDGFPTFDTDERSARTKFFVAATQVSAGVILTEWGNFSGNASPKMSHRVVSTVNPITKTDSIQIFYKSKFRMI